MRRFAAAAESCARARYSYFFRQLNIYRAALPLARNGPRGVN
jgi:hypothetical protein